MDFKPFVGNGNGNTFLVVSQAFCQRQPDSVLLDLWRLHGVDSLLVLAPTPLGDVVMLVPGADGLWGKGSGEFCGNGSRLVARFFHESTGRHPVILSRSGERFTTHVSDENIRVRLDLPVMIGGTVLAGGEPHRRMPRFERRSDLIRFCNYRRARVSANYVRLLSRQRLEVRTFEHSINRFTSCCGTGAISMAYSCYRSGLIDRDVKVVSPGGSLDIRFFRRVLLMTGPAQIDYELDPREGIRQMRARRLGSPEAL